MLICYDTNMKDSNDVVYLEKVMNSCTNNVFNINKPFNTVFDTELLFGKHTTERDTVSYSIGLKAVAVNNVAVKLSDDEMKEFMKSDSRYEKVKELFKKYVS